MSTPTFPSVSSSPWLGFPGVVWSIAKTPMFKTGVQTSISGREARNIYWAAPIWQFQFTWELLRDSGFTVVRNGAKSFPANEYEQLVSFYLSRKGQGEAFFIKDPTDNRVTTQTVLSPAVGGETDIQLVRSFGAGGFVEPIGGLNVGGSNVIRVNGGSRSFTPNVPLDGWVRLSSPCAPGDVVTGDFDYYFKVRFGKDAAEFATYLYNFWELKQIAMISVRP